MASLQQVDNTSGPRSTTLVARQNDRLVRDGQVGGNNQRRANMLELEQHRDQMLLVDDHLNVDPSEEETSPRTLRRNRTTTRRCPVLHQAAWECNLALLEELLSDGENPNTGDNWDLTPIMSTLMRHSLQDTRRVFRGREAVLRNFVMDCREEDAERVAKSSAVLKLFFRYGADPDARSNAGKTALHYATCDGLYEASQLLLDAGATLDAQDKNGAIEEKSLLVTNLLVSHGASIDVQDEHGESPLSLVIRKGRVDMMQIVMNHHALVATRERLHFAGDVLMQAVEAESVAIARFLVESGYVSVTYQNAAGETAMHCAIAKGSTDVLKALCALDSAGSSLHSVTNRGESVFHLAARVASVHDLGILVEFCERVGGEKKCGVLNEVDASGSTVLFVAGTTTESRCVQDEHSLFAERHEKMEVLLANGARLFGNMVYPIGVCLGGDNTISPSGELSLSASTTKSAGVILPVQARRSLGQWLVECRTEGGGKYVYDLCRRWIANVPVIADSKSARMMSVLHVAVCAGYAVDLLPLLLLLPQERRSVPIFLDNLGVFVSGPNSLQFRCLVNELSVTWWTTRS